MVNILSQNDIAAMSPDEYSHHVLRYAAIRSCYAEYNVRHPDEEHGRDESLAVALQATYEAFFDVMMEDLEDFPEERRVKVLEFVLEQLNRDVLHLDKVILTCSEDRASQQ
jgi:predicted GNAT family acetyltransferase